MNHTEENTNNDLVPMPHTLEGERATLKAYEEALDVQADELNRREIEIAGKEHKVKQLKLSLEQRQAMIEQRERTLDAEIAAKRQMGLDEIERVKTEFELAFMDIKSKAHVELSTELEIKRESFGAEISSLREKRFAEVSSEVEAERKARLEILAGEIGKARKELDNERKSLAGRMAELDRQEEKLREQQDSLQTQQIDLGFEKKRLAARESRIAEREDNISIEVSVLIAETIKSYEAKISAKDDELASLRAQLGHAMRKEGASESLKAVFGDEPDTLWRKFNEYEESIKRLKDELANRPSVDIKEKSEWLEKEVAMLKAELHSVRDERDHLSREFEGRENLEVTNRKLTNTNAELNSLVEELEAMNEVYKQRIARLSTAEIRVAERDERINDIREADIKFTDTEDCKYSEAGKEQPTDEIKWLEGIEKKCRDYGIVFPQRILYAFHTALKIAEWSPIAVLAGVSGTGKSELPRLYSEFGGINFRSVAVQPNWDSQESMLGFFNSIDNRFDAQPLLRFLVQCTEELKDYMGIVLLDEMNLAHVEHYFADFLSKFEERRGKVNKNMPHIDVKLGAGISPFELKMRRNILWSGTMNQDETTKSLSDKVLDRGIVINFPSPTTLESRKSMARIDDFKERTLLRYDTWVGKTNKEGVTTKEGWVKRELNFSDDQAARMQAYKVIIEKINTYLSKVGRAVGHRVWQSVEYYIANYPTVISCARENNGESSSELKQVMHTAFEDQIVQKVMPKLRGIDTRGSSKTNCLDQIKALLEENEFNLSEDFNKACELGYGQFIWCSAHYISSGNGGSAHESTTEESEYKGGDNGYINNGE